MLSLSAIVVFGAVNLVAPRPYGNTEQKTALPVDNGRITSGYGHRKDPLRKGVSFHEGVDIAAPYGSTIRPIAPGVVVFVGTYEGFGNLVVVKHDADFTSHYAHCWGVRVKVGQSVKKNTSLGFVGATGRATGPHLHLEVRFKGQAVNPEWLFHLRGSHPKALRNNQYTGITESGEAM